MGMPIQDYVDADHAIAEEMKLEVSSVMMAVNELRGLLTQLEQLLQEQDYEGASLLGYQEISLAFVEMQRCLGGVQACSMDTTLLVQELARHRNGSEEEARSFLANMRQVTNRE